MLTQHAQLFWAITHNNKLQDIYLGLKCITEAGRHI